jgi:hypothetical protein
LTLRLADTLERSSRPLTLLLATSPDREPSRRKYFARVPPVDTKLLSHSNQVQTGLVKTASLDKSIIRQGAAVPPLARYAFSAQMGHHGASANPESLGQRVNLLASLAQGHELGDVSLGQPGKTADRPGSSSG